MYIKNLQHLRRFLTGIVVLGSYLSTQTLQSDADELSELRSEIMQLQQRLQTLEQQAQESANQSKTKATTSTKTTLDRRGLIVSNEKGFSIRIRPRIQIDSHTFFDDESATNEILLRRIRPIIQGDAGPFSWRIMPELAGTVRILDAWVDTSLSEQSYLRVGKMKQVVGYERLQSFSKGLFVERGLPSVLTPTRDMGIEYHFSPTSNQWEATLGLYDGTLDDTDLSTNANIDKHSMDFGFRLACFPWKKSDESSLKNLTFGIAATFGCEGVTINNSDRDQRIRYRTSGRNTFFCYNDGVAIDGERNRLNAFMSWYNGPFGWLSEWVLSTNELSWKGQTDTIGASAWTAQLGWVLTGESASYNGLKPKNPMGSGNGYGAFELGIRVHQLNIEDAAFVSDSAWSYARSNSVQNATAYGLALNWYLTDNVLFATNFEITDFSGLGANKPTEKALQRSLAG